MKEEEEACNQMVGPFPWLASVCAAWTLHLLFYTALAGDERKWFLLGHRCEHWGQTMHCLCKSKNEFCLLSAISDVFFYGKLLNSNGPSGSRGKSSSVISSSSGQIHLC